MFFTAWNYIFVLQYLMIKFNFGGFKISNNYIKVGSIYFILFREFLVLAENDNENLGKTFLKYFDALNPRKSKNH